MINLKNRFFITIISIGNFIILKFLPIPGVRLDNLKLSLQTKAYLKNLMGIPFNKDLVRISIFTLNISPYVNANILINLCVSILMERFKFKKKDDQKHKKQLTRIIGIIWSIFQSYRIAFYLKQVLPNRNYFSIYQIVIWLTTGVAISIYISDIITDYGLGNGSSMLIFSNIISKFLYFFKETNIEDIEKPSKRIVLAILFLALSYTFLKKGNRKIRLTSPEQSKNLTMTLHENHIPLKFNGMGVTPIILADSTINTLLEVKLLKFLKPVESLTPSLHSISYNIVYFIGYFKLILVYNSLYSKVIINPIEISKQLQKADVTVPGIRPGTDLTLYLQKEIGKVLVVEGCVLAIITTIPLYMELVLGMRSLKYLDMTSIIFLIETSYDIAYEIENVVSSNKYLNYNKN